MPKLRATTFKSSIRQSRGFRCILATSFAAFDTLKWYHMRYHSWILPDSKPIRVNGAAFTIHFDGLTANRMLTASSILICRSIPIHASGHRRNSPTDTRDGVNLSYHLKQPPGSHQPRGNQRRFAHGRCAMLLIVGVMTFSTGLNGELVMRNVFRIALPRLGGSPRLAFGDS
jgi:hypothetical protein